MTTVPYNPSLKPKIYLGILVLVAYVTAYEFLAPLIVHWSNPVPNANAFFISRLLNWGLLLTIWLYATRVEKLPLLYWSEAKFPLWKFIQLTAFIFFITFWAVLGSSIILHVLKLSHKSIRAEAMIPMFKAHPALALFTCVTAGIMEEAVFRGYLQTRLQIIFSNKYISIGVSALAFGLIHVGYGTIINVVVPFVMGLVFAFFYDKYSNIKMLMICHFLWDLGVISLGVTHLNHLHH